MSGTEIGIGMEDLPQDWLRVVESLDSWIKTSFPELYMGDGLIRIPELGSNI